MGWRSTSYHSFTVAPKTIKSIKCYFFIRRPEEKIEYNNIKISYYKGNKQKFFDLLDNVECWKTIKNLPIDWIENKRAKKIIQNNTKSSKITLLKT